MLTQFRRVQLHAYIFQLNLNFLHFFAEWIVIVTYYTKKKGCNNDKKIPHFTHTQRERERAYSSSIILEATITLVTSNLCTFKDMRRESGCLCASLSIYTYPTTKQDGLQSVYLYNLSKYLAMLMFGALTPWNTFNLFPNRAELLQLTSSTCSMSLSFRATSFSNTKDNMVSTLGVVVGGGRGSDCRLWLVNPPVVNI